MYGLEGSIELVEWCIYLSIMCILYHSEFLRIGREGKEERNKGINNVLLPNQVSRHVAPTHVGMLLPHW
jgi:hypothetical protein